MKEWYNGIQLYHLAGLDNELAVLRLGSSGEDEFEDEVARIGVQWRTERGDCRQLAASHCDRDRDAGVEHDVRPRQRHDQRRPDRLHGPRPPTARAGVLRPEVQPEPVAPGVVDRSAPETKLSAHQAVRRQVEGCHHRKHDRVVRGIQLDQVDAGRSDVEPPVDGVGDRQASGKDDVGRHVSWNLQLERGRWSSRQTDGTTFTLILHGLHV